MGDAEHDDAAYDDAEYDAAVHLAVTLGFTQRYGPSDDEIADFPAWKKVAIRVLPRKHRWRLSVYAPLIAGMGKPPHL